MKTKYLINTVIVLFLLGIAISPVGFMACKDDQVDKSEPYFNIESYPAEQLPAGLKVTIDEKNQKYTVRSNRPWKVVAQSDYDWVRSFPDEGDDDGIFEIRVKKNTTIQSRIADFAFVVDGKEKPTLFRVEQDAAIPALTVTPSPLVSILPGGGKVDIAIDANVEWRYTLADAGWLKDPVVTSKAISFTALKNETGGPRETTLTITPVDAKYIDLEVKLTVKQISERIDDGQAVGFVYFEDDFAWVAPFKGCADIENYSACGTHNIYTYANAEDGIAAGDLVKALTDHGYTDINAAKTSFYFQSHYIKMGKTDVQAGIQRTIPQTDQEKVTNILLTFDATPCKSAANNYDKVVVVVEIDGPGSVGVDDGMTKKSIELSVQLENGGPWTWIPLSVKLYAVSADTKVTIKTNKSGGDPGTFRWYLDNLKFVKESIVTP